MAFQIKDNKKDANLKRLNKMIEELREDREPSVREIAEKLELIKNGRMECNVKPFSLYLDVIDVIRESALQPDRYADQLKNAENLYDKIFMFGEKTPDFEKTAEVFLLLAGENGLAARGYFDMLLFSAFSDKGYYVTLVQAVAAQRNGLKIFICVKKYGLSVREYFVDDVSFLANLLKLVGKLSSVTSEKYEQIMEAELTAIKRSNGLYDIDPVRLAQVEKNVSQAAMIIDGGRNILENMESRSKGMERMSRELDDKAREISKTTAAYLESKADNAKAHLDETLAEYETSQKQAVFLEKEVFIKQLFSDAESELGKYKTMARSITSAAAADVATIRRDTDDLIRRLKDAAYNEEKLTEFAERSRKDKEILDKIDVLTMLNDSIIEKISKQVEEDKKENVPEKGKNVPPVPGDGRPPMPPMPGDGRPPMPPMPGDGRPPMPPVPGDGRPPMPPMPGDGRPPMPPMPEGGRPPMAPPAPAGENPAMVVTVAGGRKNRPIPSINPLLDPAVPFKQRFELVMKEKERRLDRGEIFHEAFDDVVTAVMEEANPYLIGPSGCGKTYMVKQVAELLNVDCTDIGYVNEEYDILGYVTAMGEYSESNFYRMYKYGGIAFCDELDNGNSKATVKLNSFLSNQEHACYYFPGGERVEKHPNFRVIAAGNTDGSGANVNYSTRERIEESVQQRMTPIYVGYDNRVEENILKDYPDWFEFGCQFRLATDRWEEVCGIPAQGIFTTRDAYRIKRYLDNGSFTPEKIIHFDFVQTKELEYLGFLTEEMGKSIKRSSDAYELYRLFADETARLRKRGKRV